MSNTGTGMLAGTTGTYHLNVHVHGKLEILNGESNDLCLSVWEDSEHMGWDLNGVLFYTFFRLCPVYLDIVYSGPSSHCVKFYSFIFMYKNSIGMVCINGKHTDYIKILTGT